MKDLKIFQKFKILVLIGHSSCLVNYYNNNNNNNNNNNDNNCKTQSLSIDKSSSVKILSMLNIHMIYLNNIY